MTLNYIKSSSTVKPESLDATSSPNVVYVRKNIVERTEDDTTYYDYDEVKIDKTDWKYLANIIEMQNNQEVQDNLLLDIDYRLMMLEESTNE